MGMFAAYDDGEISPADTFPHLRLPIGIEALVYGPVGNLEG